MNDVENALLLALEAKPDDWSIRFLIAEKRLENSDPAGAAEIVASAPSPPAEEFELHRVAEIAGGAAIPLVEAYIAANPANSYGHVLLADLLEHAGDLGRAEQHRSVAMALGSGDRPIHATGPVPLAPSAPPPPDLVFHESIAESEPHGEVEEYFVSPPKQRGTKATAALLAIAFHLVIGIIAALVVILPPSKDEPEIVAAVIGPPAKKQEMQKKNVVKQTKKTSASSAAAAPLAQLMRANALAKIALPEVTRTSKGPLGIGDADFGGGGFGGGGGGLGSGASFFGGTSTGKRFLFVIDHSGSMKPNQVKLRNDELEKALKSLKGVQYQVLLFAGGAYYGWEGWTFEKKEGNNANTMKGPKGSYRFVSKQGAGNFDFDGPESRLPQAEWVEAKPSNVSKTMKKVKEEKLFYGTDWGLALDIGHRMDPPPDVIFFMSDGTGGNSPPPILETNRKYGKPPINTVAMQTTQGLNEFAEIAKKTGGSFTIVDKNGEPIDGFEFQKNPDKFKGRL